MGDEGVNPATIQQRSASSLYGSGDNVAGTHPDYDVMIEAWELIDDLMGGTRTMKARAGKWLPREPGEEPASYRSRLSRSVLFNAMKKAVNDLSRRPFAKPVTLNGQDQLGPRLTMMLQAVDDERRNLTQFCHLLLATALKRGLVHILVDYPPVRPENFEIEKAGQFRPRLLCIDPKDLIGWRFEIADNGDKRLTQIRIRETATENHGTYGTTLKDRVRVINEHTWELWEKDINGDWHLEDRGDYTLGRIALVSCYLNKTGFMTAESPLEDLAWLNLAHYQSQSDHRNNLRFFRTGMFLAKGLSPEDMDKAIVLGVTHSFKTTSPDADIRMVEHSGAACDAGEKELDRLEQQMEAVGKAPLVTRQWGNETAMGRAIDAGTSQCDLQAYVREIEGAVNAAFALAGEWANEPLPEDLGLDIYDDFGLILRSQEDMGHLQTARDRGDIDQETFLEEAKLRGMLRETADIQEIMRRTRRAGPPLGMVGREGQRPEQEPQEQ